jgi:hypothetical protein
VFGFFIELVLQLQEPELFALPDVELDTAGCVGLIEFTADGDWLLLEGLPSPFVVVPFPFVVLSELAALIVDVEFDEIEVLLFD